MMRRRSFLVALLLPLLLLPLPAHAQQADTTETDTTAADTTAATAPADTASTDTARTNGPVADTAQAPMAPDTLVADSLAPADTALSAEARRDRAKERAQIAAEAWLALTDDGQFGASWDEAAASLQRSVSREAWQKRGAQVRATLDSLTNRTLTRAVYRDSTTQIPGGAPVVALQYRTAFAGQSALEAVITTKQDTGWKVAGYRVVPPPADSAQARDSTQAQPNPDTTQSASEPDSTQGR